MDKYPSITVGELRAHLAGYPDQYTIDFSGLTFYRVKQRAEAHLQLEFGQTVYRDHAGRVVVENHE
jgi:hypothetical protein